MKAKLEFNLPADKDDLHTAKRGSDYLFALEAFAAALRNGMKYKDKEWEEISEVFYDILEEYKINVFEEVE